MCWSLDFFRSIYCFVYTSVPSKWTNMLKTITQIYLVQKETQCFYLHLLELKNVDFKNCFNSVFLPFNKDLDCIVSSLIGYCVLFKE